MQEYLIKKDRNKAFIFAIFVICVFLSLYDLFILTVFTQIDKIVSLIMCLIISYALISHSRVHIDKKAFITLIPFVVLLLAHMVLANCNIRYVVLIVPIMLLAILAPPKLDIYIKPLKVLFAFCVVFCMGVIIAAVYPQIKTGVISSLYGLTDVLDSHMNSGINARAPIASTFIIIGIGLIPVLKTQSKKPRRLKRFLLYGMFFLGLMLTGKRAHLLFGVAALLFTYAMSTTQKMKRFIILIIVLCAAIVMLYMLQPVLQTFRSMDRIYTSIETILAEGGITDSVAMSRLGFQERAWNLFKTAPIVGVGWGNYKALSNSTMAAHNVYLQLLSETGIVGFGLFFFLLISMLVRTMRLLREFIKHAKDTLKLAMVQFSLFYQVFFILYCCTGNPLYDRFYIVMLMFVYIILVSADYFHAEKMRAGFVKNYRQPFQHI